MNQQTTFNDSIPRSSFSSNASGITAQWIYSPGELNQKASLKDDFHWETASTIAVLDWDVDESSISEEGDEFGEDVVEDLNGIVLQMVKEDQVPPPPPSSLTLQRCYREFKEMSCSPSPPQVQETRTSISSLVRSRTQSARHLNGRKRLSNQRLSTSDHNRLSRSDHNRDLIRQSMKDALNF